MPDCTVCRHPEVSRINELLKEGKRSVRSISDEFNISKSTIQRHKTDHLTLSLIAGTEEGIAIHDSVKDLNVRALSLLKKAENSRDLRGALAAIKECRANFDLLGRLSGELNAGTTINSGISLDEFGKFQSIVLQEICPECRQRVLARMEGLRVVTVQPIEKAEQDAIKEAISGAPCST